MRIIGSIETNGNQYQTIWATLSWIENQLDDHGGSKALAVRDGAGANHAIIARNAKLAEVEEALRQLRHLGIKDSHLCDLFGYKGPMKGLGQHVKELVSNMR
jgi:hypothetical protein